MLRLGAGILGILIAIAAHAGEVRDQVHPAIATLSDRIAKILIDHGVDAQEIVRSQRGIAYRQRTYRVHRFRDKSSEDYATETREESGPSFRGVVVTCIVMSRDELIQGFRRERQPYWDEVTRWIPADDDHDVIATMQFGLGLDQGLIRALRTVMIMDKPRLPAATDSAISPEP